MSALQLAQETWDQVWPEVEDLAREHFDEVDGGVEPLRPLKIDAQRMRAMSLMGCLRIFTARRDSKLIGYCSWVITPDVESEGLMIANQGAWFVRKGSPPTTGYRLFERSLCELKLLGVSLMYPHHRLQGRASDLSRFFKHFGAKPIQVTYSLWIGEQPQAAAQAAE